MSEMITEQFNKLARLNQLKADALNIPVEEIKEILEKWDRCIGLNDNQLLSLYYFYRDLELKLRILSPDFNLALNEVNRRKSTLELSMWARFNNDTQFFLD